MEKAVELTNLDKKNYACMLIQDLEEDNHEVVIRPVKKNRSLNQHSLYWQYCTFIGNDLGETKDEVHMRNKKRHLLPILIRENLQGVGDMLSTIQTIADNGLPAQADFLRRRLAYEITTTTLSTKQMAEFMEQV